MIEFIIATHGNFASGIKNSVDLIVGEVKNLHTICCYTKDKFNLKEEVIGLLNRYKNKDIIVLTDIFGGSVNNEFLKYIEKYPNLYIITGVNLSLILFLIENQDEIIDIKKLIKRCIDECSNSIKYCNEEIYLNENLQEEDF